MRRLAIIDLNQRRLDLCLSRATQASWETSFSHHHSGGNDCNLHYVVTGRIDLVRDGEQTVAEAGDLIISFPGDVIDYHFTGPLTLIHCHFSFANTPLLILGEELTEWGAGVDAAGHGFASHVILPDHMALHEEPESVKLLEELPRLFSPCMPSEAILATATLLRMLSLVSRATFQQLAQRAAPGAGTGRHAHVHAALRHISEHLDEPLAVHEIASALGIDTDYLGRLFKQALGVSLGTWIMRARMAKARQLLAESTCSIKEVANAVGYVDALYFARVFRREMGTPPTLWRTRQRNAMYAPGPRRHQ